MSFDVDFVQAETQLFSGGPCTRFGVTQSTMSRLYSCLTKILEACINEFPLWPDKTSIQESVPATFKNLYPDTRVIIDSAEIETDRSHNPYSVSDVVRLQASNCQELHHLSIHKRIATRRLVKVCTFLTTLILPFVDLPPKKINEFSRALLLDFRFYPFAFLRCIIFLSYFFFKFALLMTVPQSAHLCDATEHLQLCTDLMGLL